MNGKKNRKFQKMRTETETKLNAVKRVWPESSLIHATQRANKFMKLNLPCIFLMLIAVTSPRKMRTELKFGIINAQINYKMRCQMWIKHINCEQKVFFFWHCLAESSRPGQIIHLTPRDLHQYILCQRRCYTLIKSKEEHTVYN